MPMIPNSAIIPQAPMQAAPQMSPFQQFSQGFLGSPWLGMGAGLLAGAQPGGTLAGGLNLGLANAQNMMRQQQATAMMGMQIQAMQAKRMQEENERKQRAAIAAAYGVLPGTDPTSKQIEAYTLAQGDPTQYQQQLSRLTEKGPLVQNIVGGEGSKIWTPEQKAAAGLAQDDVVVENAKGEPKILKSGEKKQEAYRNLDRVNRAFDRYERILDEVGPTAMPTAEGARLSSAYSDIMLEAKELYNLGVLNGPDLEIMERVMKNPTDITNQLYGKDAFKEQLEVFKQKLQEARDRLDTEYGEIRGDEPVVNWNDL